MKILVCGGRDFTDRKLVYAALDEWDGEYGITLVIHGAARGADTLAEDWAKDRDVPYKPFPAKWTDLTTPPVRIRYRSDGSAYNSLAGSIRNATMLTEKPDVVFAFPGGSGTADMVAKAKRANVHVVSGIKESP